MTSLKCHKNILSLYESVNLKRRVACLCNSFTLVKSDGVGNIGRLYG